MPPVSRCGTVKRSIRNAIYTLFRRAIEARERHGLFHCEVIASSNEKLIGHQIILSQDCETLNAAFNGKDWALACLRHGISTFKFWFFTKFGKVVSLSPSKLGRYHQCAHADSLVNMSSKTLIENYNIAICQPSRIAFSSWRYE